MADGEVLERLQRQQALSALAYASSSTADASFATSTSWKPAVRQASARIRAQMDTSPLASATRRIQGPTARFPRRNTRPTRPIRRHREALSTPGSSHHRDALASRTIGGFAPQLGFRAGTTRRPDTASSIPSTVVRPRRSPLVQMIGDPATLRMGVPL